MESGKKHPRILVAEDNTGNYKLVEVLLRQDYEIIHAADGSEAVELFRQQGADLVLMDIRMPIMDGFDAFEQIRRISPTVPVIALTAYAFETDRQRMADVGFNDCICKPICADLLRTRISQLLNL